MKKYALINKENSVVENIILWDGIKELIIPQNYYTIELANDHNVLIRAIYEDGSFINPTSSDEVEKSSSAQHFSNLDYLKYTDDQKIKYMIKSQSEDNKFLYIYVHVPKTSGTFIKSIVSNSVEQNKILIPFQIYEQRLSQIPLHILNHPTISLISKIIPSSNLPNIKFFSVVRNPFDRTYSLWKWLNLEKKILTYKSSPADKDILCLRTLYPVPDNFKEFLYKLKDGYYDYLYFSQPQSHYFLGSEDKVLEIFKMEEMHRIKKFLLDNQIGSWSDKKVNDIPSKKYTEVYNQKMVSIVREKYHKDFETFGYSMDL
jgi:hypothetical protein